MGAKVGSLFLLLLRVGLAGVFLYAGTLKVWDFAQGQSATQQFALDILHYEIVPWDVALIAAVYLPWVEILSGVALLLRRWDLGALLLLNALMVVFILAIGSAWMRGLDISCGCFGKPEEAIQTNYPLILGRDFALLAGLVILLVVEWRRPSVASSMRPLQDNL